MVIHQTWRLSSLRLVRRTTSFSKLKLIKNMYVRLQISVYILLLNVYCIIFKFSCILQDEIQELLQVETFLTNIEVVERCFGPQSKSHVVGFGGGITSKDLKGGSTAKTALLEELKASRKEKVVLLEELNATRKENESMKRRLDNIEKKCKMFESVIFRDPSSPPSSSE